MAHMNDWIGAMIKSLDDKVDENARIRILEDCGRACAKRRAVKKVQALKARIKDLDKLLQEINKQHFWTDNLYRDNNTIYAIYSNCYCALIREGPENLSPSFCYCSRGWVKELAELIVEKPVEIEIVQTIKRGGTICKFAIHY